MKIEKIGLSEILKATELLKKLYLELGEEKESITFVNEALITKLISDNKTIILKAEVNQTIVGILTLTESQAIYCGGSFGSIDEMYVEPKYRSQKIGAALVEKAIEIAHQKKWIRIDVTAPTNENPKTINFYKRCGFVFTGPKLKLKLNPEAK